MGIASSAGRAAFACGACSMRSHVVRRRIGGTEADEAGTASTQTATRARKEMRANQCDSEGCCVPLRVCRDSGALSMAKPVSVVTQTSGSQQLLPGNRWLLGRHAERGKCRPTVSLRVAPTPSTPSTPATRACHRPSLHPHPHKVIVARLGTPLPPFLHTTTISPISPHSPPSLAVAQLPPLLAASASTLEPPAGFHLRRWCARPSP